VTVTDGFAYAGGLRLHYLEWGSAPAGDDAAIVLVHGVGSSAHIWDLCGPSLASKTGQRVVAIDQRGHGESDQPDAGYDFQSVVEDLCGFMDSLGIVEPALLVGHSWGASVVLHFAEVHPDRTAAIALIDGGTASPGERMNWADAEKRLTPPEIDGMLWTDLRKRMSGARAYSDPRAESVGRSLFHVDADGRIRRRFRVPNHMQVVRALWEQRPAEILARLRCPVLVLPARQESDNVDYLQNKIAGVERVQQLQPSAQVRWFENTVHDIPLQRPDELVDELSAFAADVLPARAQP
jgi:pimeloyl-ACP methyl ester carboxylesterase